MQRSYPAGKPFGVPITAEALTDLDAHRWELYHVADDPAENHNLTDQHRDKLIDADQQHQERVDRTRGGDRCLVHPKCGGDEACAAWPTG
jgi:arylsulfatase A-like enzyme